MKDNKGMGTIKLIIFVVIIGLIVAMGVYFSRMKYNQARIETIKTDMLQIQWKLKDYMDKQTIKREEKKYLGEKVSQMQEDEGIKEFINKGILSSEEYDKYYVLKDEDLAEATSEITNYQNSYFLVNYENYEIILTSGFEYMKGKTLYKLSDFQNVADKK
jgi:Tfp pilus assembly protein PilE